MDNKWKIYVLLKKRKHELERAISHLEDDISDEAWEAKDSEKKLIAMLKEEIE